MFLIIITKFEKQNQQKFISILIKNILLIDKKPKIICFGVPSLIINKKCIEPKNLKALNNLDLEKIGKKLGAKVFATNDANCFALGETFFGKGQKYSNIVGITLGTGIGAGIIINKQLYTGKFGGAGEIGRIHFKNETELENYCSSKFFSKMGKNGKDFFILAEDGNLEAKNIFLEFGKNVGLALALVINIYNPEVVIFGGSITKTKKYFEKSMLQTAKKYCYNKIFKTTKIFFSTNEDSSLLGASMLCKLKK